MATNTIDAAPLGKPIAAAGLLGIEHEQGA
jgi:hypothetical protein